MATKKPLRIGLIGYGFMGRTHSNAFRKVPNFFDLKYEPQLTAVCARNKDRAEAFASRQGVFLAFWDGLMMGLGFTIILVLLGSMREILGKGTLFSQADLMFGNGADWITLTVFDNYSGFLLAILPPGAFFGLAFIIAIKNIIDNHQSHIK